MVLAALAVRRAVIPFTYNEWMDPFSLEHSASGLVLVVVPGHVGVVRFILVSPVLGNFLAQAGLALLGCVVRPCCADRTCRAGCFAVTRLLPPLPPLPSFAAMESPGIRRSPGWDSDVVALAGAEL